MGIAALGSHTGYQQRQRGGQFPHAGNFSRVGGTHHQAKLAVHIPRALGQAGNVLVQPGLAVHAGQALVLQVVAAGVGGAAQQVGPFAWVLQVGQHGVEAHEGREGDAVGLVTLKGFFGVLLGGGADVATLGIQNHRHLRGHAAHVGHQLFELVFGAVGRKIGDLRLERLGNVGGGIDNGRAEIEDFAGIALPGSGEAAGFGVQPHAQQGVVLR